MSATEHTAEASRGVANGNLGAEVLQTGLMEGRLMTR
jgi:hypothetical protein